MRDAQKFLGGPVASEPTAPSAAYHGVVIGAVGAAIARRVVASLTRRTPVLIRIVVEWVSIQSVGDSIMINEHIEGVVEGHDQITNLMKAT